MIELIRIIDIDVQDHTVYDIYVNHPEYSLYMLHDVFASYIPFLVSIC